MDFREEFDGVICIDAMEHVCPEDWPGILRRFREALRPDGVLYLTVVLAEADELEKAYERAKERRLPVVLAGPADESAYHYCPSMEQVRAWIGQAGLVIEEEGTGNWFEHFVVRKR